MDRRLQSLETNRHFCTYTATIYPINYVSDASRLLLWYRLCSRRLFQSSEDNAADRNHTSGTNSIRCLSPSPPVERTKQDGTKSPSDLAEAPMAAQLPASFGVTSLEAAEAVQAGDDGRAGDGEERGRDVEQALVVQAAEQHEGGGARHHAHLHHAQRVHAPHHAALQHRRDQPDEPQQPPVLLRPVRKQVVRHERQRELHAREEQDEREVREVEQPVWVGARAALRRLLRVAVGLAVGLAVCVRGAAHGGERLGQGQPQVQGLGDDEDEGEAGGGGERVGGEHGLGGEPRAQRRPERERDAEARAHQRHRRTALAVRADVGGDRRRQLHVALAQAAHDSVCQERPEVGCGDPERDGQYIAHH